MHWGYFSKKLRPLLEVDSGDIVTIETLTHQASDDHERMIEGDPGAESVYLWTKDKKGVFRRGAGEESIFLGIIRPGEPAGEMAMIAGTVHSSTVVALRDSEVLAMPRDIF